MVSNGSGPGIDPDLQLQVLGPVRAWRRGVELDVGPPQQALLLSILLAQSGQVTSVGRLVESLWGDDAPASAVNTIHKRIGAIRRLLEPETSPRSSGSYVQRRSGGYVWSTGDAVLDLDVFRARTAAARAALALGHDGEALDLFAEALRLWVGPAGVGFDLHSESASIFSALNAEFAHASVDAAALADQLRRPDSIVTALELAASMSPMDEEVQAAYIRTLNAAGRRADALGVFLRVRSRLVEELGIDPGPALTGAHRRILDAYSSPDDGAARRLRVPSRDVHDRAVATEPHRIADFTGRRNEIELIESFLGSDPTPPTSGPLLVTGPPGVGKTTTVLEAARRAETSATRIFVDLHGFDDVPLSPPEVLRAVLSQVNPDAAPPASFDEASAAWRKTAASGPLIVVLDNASSETQVRPVLSGDGLVKVVITSRRTLPGLTSSHRIRLGPLTRAESEALLTSIVGAVGHDGRAVSTLAALCGDLPLALRIAGARLASRPQWSADDLIRRLADEKRRLPQLVAGDLDVEAAFSLSYNALHPATRALFQSLAALHDCAFTADMMAVMQERDPDTTRDQLDTLVDLGLVENTVGDRYRVHDLLRLYAADRWRDETSDDVRRKEEEALDRWLLAQASRAAKVFPDPWEIRPAARPDEEDLRAAQRWLTTETEHWYGALNRAAERGDYAAVTDAAASLARISSVWEHFSRWSRVHELGASASAALGDAGSHTKQLLARAIAIAAEDPGDGDAERAAREALDAAESLSDARYIAWARSLLADALAADGDDEGSLRESRIAAAEFHRLGDLNGELETRAWGLLTLSMVDPDAAQTEAESLVSLLDGLGDAPELLVNPSALLSVLNGSARVFLDAQRFEDALAVSVRMEGLREPVLGNGGYAARAAFAKGFSLLGLHRNQEARESLEFALAWQRPYLPESWGSRLRAALASIDEDEATAAV